MSVTSGLALPEALERAASALPRDADGIRPANGDPSQLHRLLDTPSAARVLQWLLENEPAAGAQLADAWAEDPDCDPALLEAVDSGSLPKAAQKALRRAHHRLRSRGIAVAAAPVPKVVATIGRVEDDLFAAALTPLDPRGSRIAYVVEENPSGGARIFEIMFDEERGIVGFEVYSAARGKARRFLRQLTSKGRLPAVEAPPEAVRALIARVSRYQPANRPPPRAFIEWRARVAVAPEGAATPGELARQALGAAEPGLVGRVVAMIRERELGPWPPENPALQAAAEKIVDLGKSELVVPAATRSEQVDEIIRETVAGTFGGGFASRCAERFEETAFVFWRQDRGEDARACLAAADAFRGELSAYQEPARAMLDVLLGPALSALEAGNDASPSEAT
jgi:hypothetical protein